MYYQFLPTQVCQGIRVYRLKYKTLLLPSRNSISVVYSEFQEKIDCFVFQSLSCVQLFVTLWTLASQAFLSFTISQNLLKFMSTELVILSNHLILCCPLLLTSIFSSIRVFSNDLALCIRWPKYQSFSLSKEYSGLIFFRIDWFDLFAVQQTLKSLLQHHNSTDSN